VRFFFDNTLSFRLARALDTLLEAEGHQVVALRDYPFDAQVRDEEWLPVLAQEGDWIVITGDLSKKDKDRHIWKRSGLRCSSLSERGRAGVTSSLTSARVSSVIGRE